MVAVIAVHNLLEPCTDGRFLETQVQLLAEGKGMSWGFVLREVRTNSVLRIIADK